MELKVGDYVRYVGVEQYYFNGTKDDICRIRKIRRKLPTTLDSSKYAAEVDIFSQSTSEPQFGMMYCYDDETDKFFEEVPSHKGWVLIGKKGVMAKCLVCKHKYSVATIDKYNFKYCPNCGSNVEKHYLF